MSKEIKAKIRQKIFSQYSSIFSQADLEIQQIKERISVVAEEIIKHEYAGLSGMDKIKIINDLVDEMAGFGAIEPLLKDPRVSEIMINGPRKIYAERNGKTELTGISFDDETQVMYLVNKMLTPTRRHVDEAFPFTDISLPDGSRVNIVIPPLALDGPTVTIRKFLKEIKSADDLVKLGTMDKRMSDFLVAAIKAKLNIIFSGATGAGKTTTLNVLSTYIDDEERIITIEDTAELHLSQEHVVRLESRHSNIEGRGEVSIRDLFKNSLRMRPDRIILGEIRGSEAIDMLQAICSGHHGSLVVLHANSPMDVIYRIETMILTSGLPISMEAIHRQIAAAVNLIVQQEQLSDGSRKITHITQINGLKEGRAILEDLFVYDFEGLDADGKAKGRWNSTGVIPLSLPVFKKAGIELPQGIFKKD